MQVRGRAVPSFLISVGFHVGILLLVGLAVGVSKTKTFELVEMAISNVTRSAPEPPPPAPPPEKVDSAPVRARRTRAAAPPPAPVAAAPAADPGPPVPDADPNAMPAAPAAAGAGASDGVLGGSHAPNAAAPGAAGAAAPAPERRVYDMGDLDAPPSLVGSCTAEVPAFARQTRQSGWVMVQFTLGPDGHVQAPRVRASSPSGVFDRAALDAIRRCRYTAPRVGGRPVAVTYRQRLRFEP